MKLVEDAWYGIDPKARMLRGALWPLARLYGAGVAARRTMYDAGVLRTERPIIPVVSIGNLTVGGTGKTPVAAWLATQLSRHARPAVVLRGYGADEIEVHRHLNPRVPVIARVDRVAAVREAADEGADLVILDDGFQYRRLARTVDIVLLSAEQLMRPLRLLPAGPWREPLQTAGRADLLIVTRKSARPIDAERARAKLQGVFPGLPIASVHLSPAALESVDGQSAHVRILQNVPVTAIAAIGEPHAFGRQLEQLGAHVTLHAFRDHHVFSDAEISDLASRVPPGGYAVCTLKDAVKLADRWPASTPLWYVSQRLVVEDGAEDMNVLLERALAARTSTTTTAG